MRRSGQIVREVLEVVKAKVAPGVATMDLERMAEDKIRELGAKPAFKGYHDYPCVLCTSVNDEIIHGIPSEKRILKPGDIVSIDCGVVMGGYYGDSAITVPVGGALSPELQKLLEVTEAALKKAIQHRACCAMLVRNAIGFANLAENFRFTEHHGIKAGSDTEKMANGVAIVMVIERRAEQIKLNGMETAEIIRESGGGFVRGFVRDAVHLAAIARGEDESFMENAARAKFLGRPSRLVVGERHALAHLNWR